MTPLTLLDYKTGGYRSLEEELQISAYFGCTHRWDSERRAWVEWNEKIEQAGIVHVWEGGCHVETRLTLAQLETASSKFQECLDVFTWMVGRGKARIPENESYRVNGRYYPSVTYIIQHVIAKPNLMNWSYEMGVAAGVWAGTKGQPPEGGLDLGTALEIKRRLDAKTLKRTDPDARPWMELLKGLDDAGKSATARRDGRAAQGSSIHKNILFYLQGHTIQMNEAPDWLREALIHFMGWAAHVNLKPVYLEQKLMNDEVGYAGTADFIGGAELESKPVVTASPGVKDQVIEVGADTEAI